MAQVLPTLTRQQLGQVFADPRTLLAFEAYLRQIALVVPNDITALQNLDYVVTTVDPSVTPNAHAVAAGANISATVTPGLITFSVSPAGSDGQIQFNSAGVLGAFTLSGDASVNVASGVLTIAANAVTSGKFRQSGALSIVGNATNATANVADISAVAASNQVLRERGSALVWGSLTVLLDDVFGTTQGGVLYRDATAWTLLAPGIAGDLLQTNGAGANPSWAAPPVSAGSWLPLVTGAEPPVLVSDGAGHLITVAYAP